MLFSCEVSKDPLNWLRLVGHNNTVDFVVPDDVIGSSVVEVARVTNVSSSDFCPPSSVVDEVIKVEVGVVVSSTFTPPDEVLAVEVVGEIAVVVSTDPPAEVMPKLLEVVEIVLSGFCPPSSDVVVGKTGVVVEIFAISLAVGMPVAVDIVDFVDIIGIFGVVEDVVIVASSVFLSSGLVVELDCCVVVSAVKVETSEAGIEIVLTVVASSIILPSSFSVVVDDDSVVDVDLDGIWSTVLDDVKSVAGVRFSMDVLCTSGISV